MERTAIEWFFNELSEVERNLINKTFLQNNKTLAGNTLRGLLEQAKEMEKQQMKMAQMHYSSDVLGFKTLLEKQFEDWYNEKFKTK